MVPAGLHSDLPLRDNCEAAKPVGKADTNDAAWPFDSSVRGGDLPPLVGHSKPSSATWGGALAAEDYYS